MNIEQPRFLSKQKAFEIAEKFSTPCYVYDEQKLISQAKTALAFPNAFGITVRYAMKAASNKNILKLFNSLGLKIDASSAFEVKRAMLAGIKGEDISLSSQQLPDNLKEIIEAGVKYNACSIHQLESYGKLFPNTEVGVRINPGLGSGGTKRTNVGGPASSFGIWFEYIEQIKLNILNNKLEGNLCPLCNSELTCRIAQMYDLEDNLQLHPKAHCTKCPFQIR